MNRLPESPMKSRAGGRFQNRNPASAPPSTTRSSTRPGPSGATSSAARNNAAISATPAARPSMLSRRFTAWHRPANHTVAMSVSVKGIEPAGTVPASRKTRKAPMASDATSLASGDSCSRSSKMPTQHMASAASSTGAHGSPKSTAPSCVRPMTKATMVAPAIATPPIVGVGWLCQRSGRGGTTAPIDADSRRITAPSRIDATSAARKPPTSGSNWNPASISSRRDRSTARPGRS